VQVGKDLLSGGGIMEWVSAIRNGNVEARVDGTKLSEGHGLR